MSTMVTVKSQSEQITEAIKRLKILSELLEDLDAVRDRAISALGHVLNEANMPTADAHRHTPPLKKVFDNYTLSVTRENYESESLWSNHCLLIWTQPHCKRILRPFQV